jgi:hypothetical protein
VCLENITILEDEELEESEIQQFSEEIVQIMTKSLQNYVDSTKQKFPVSSRAQSKISESLLLKGLLNYCQVNDSRKFLDKKRKVFGESYESSYSSLFKKFVASVEAGMKFEEILQEIETTLKQRIFFLYVFLEGREFFVVESSGILERMLSFLSSSSFGNTHYLEGYPYSQFHFI